MPLYLLRREPGEPDREIPIKDLLTPSQIAERFGVSRPAVSNWIKRGGFPEPLLTIEMVRLYSARDVVTWISEQRVRAIRTRLAKAEATVARERDLLNRFEQGA